MRKLWLCALLAIPLSLLFIPLSIIIGSYNPSAPFPPKDFIMGPFVGHTTFNSSILWARIPDSTARAWYGHPTHALDHLRIRQQGSLDPLVGVSVLVPDWSTAPAPFSPSDSVIAFKLVNLPASTRVEVEMDFGSGGHRLTSFKTFPLPDSLPTKTSFVFGSCRAPDVSAWITGSWSGGDGDKVFRTIMEYEKDDLPSFVLFLGDQIYSDLNEIPYPVMTEEQSTLDFYLGKYRQAFGNAGISQLMSSVPTYMLLDDHDIVNDYPGAVPLSTREKKDQYVDSGAKQSYLTYQYIHSPLGFSPKAPPFSSTYGGGLDFSFAVSSMVRVFALDMRVERDLVNGKMISDRQMALFLRWLKREDDPIFNGISVVVSPLVFSPDLVIGESLRDSWGMYPENQAKIMRAIEEATLQSFRANSPPLRVLILSGDIHASSWSSLVKNVTYATSSSPNEPITKEIRVFSVVSSPLAWGGFAYFFTKLGIFPTQHLLLRLFPRFRAGEAVNWTVGPRASSIALTSNYVRVDVETPDKISVRCRSADGKLAGYLKDELSWGY